MTKVVDGCVIIEPEAPVKCEYCGKIAECRPYGENGKEICYKCGMKPENIKMMRKNASRILFGEGA